LTVLALLVFVSLTSPRASALSISSVVSPTSAQGQSQRLAGPKTGVSEQRDECRIPLPSAEEQVTAQLLYFAGSKCADCPPPLLLRLLHDSNGVRAETAPLDGPLQDSLEQDEGLSDCLVAHAGSSKINLEPLNPLGR
jgi:hypothetical protein